MKSPQHSPLRILTTVMAGLAACLWMTTAPAEEPAKSAGSTPEQEAKFIATLTNATLKGRWCGVKDGNLGPEKEDSYTIVSVTKLGGDKWLINARLPYGGKEIDLPIPAQVKWAGDTPILVLDNISMGTPRAYSARVMIYEKTYSGWWAAPDHGGLLSGVIVNGKN
ncbi:MAG: hypothetical protein ABJF10_15840 [Chthoniobacter sp.]|uniref:hypothetical protein n=1 Tax=Chthoniobacter sp. TaxID=2510640 RepID=UPI0032AE268A